MHDRTGELKEPDVEGLDERVRSSLRVHDGAPRRVPELPREWGRNDRRGGGRGGCLGDGGRGEGEGGVEDEGRGGRGGWPGGRGGGGRDGELARLVGA